MKKRDLIIVLLILAVFIVPRFLGVHQIYHEDEHTWISIADGSDSSPGPHPPLFREILTFSGRIIGFFNLRWIPFLFATLNLVLLYFVAKKKSGKTAALIALGLFAVNIYSIVASLQVDIDGMVLPFFVLFGYYAYISLQDNIRSKKWWFLFALAVIGGLLTKLSFVLFLGAVLLDFSWALFLHDRTNLKKILWRMGTAIFALAAVGAIFYIFYTSRSHLIIDYARHFKSFNFGSRKYLDLIYKIGKSFVWLSPLLLFPIIGGLLRRDVFARNRFWFIYLVFNLIFYTILFDFATLAIERYFMFLIVPSVIIGGDFLHTLFQKIHFSKTVIKTMAAVTLFTVFSIAILSIPHMILPLNPKIAYFQHVKSLDFSFLIPFSSGSGPIGFYFSAWFILLSWVLSAVFLLGSAYLKKLGGIFLISFLIFGVGYNVLFVNELLFGSLYGSPAKIARASVDYVIQSRNISEVITYNDIGVYDLQKSGKYYSRFYVTPTRDYTEKLSAFRGYYMVVDFPLIDKNNKHWKLIEKCPILKTFTDKEIHSYVFDCRKIKLK